MAESNQLLPHARLSAMDHVTVLPHPSAQAPEMDPQQFWNTPFPNYPPTYASFPSHGPQMTMSTNQYGPNGAPPLLPSAMSQGMVHHPQNQLPQYQSLHPGPSYSGLGAQQIPQTQQCPPSTMYQSMPLLPSSGDQFQTQQIPGNHQSPQNHRYLESHAPPRVMEPAPQQVQPGYMPYALSSYMNSGSHGPHTPPLQMYDYTGYPRFAHARSANMPSSAALNAATQTAGPPVATQPIAMHTVGTQTDRFNANPPPPPSLGRTGSRSSARGVPFEHTRQSAAPRRRPSYDRRQYRTSITLSRPLDMSTRAEGSTPNPNHHRTRSTSPAERTSHRRNFDHYAEDPQGRINEDSVRMAQRRRMMQSGLMRRSSQPYDPNVPTEKQMQALKDKLRHFIPSKLPADTSPTCDICQKDYHSGYVPPSEKEEIAIQLPCKHFFGEHCINTWFDTCKKYKHKITCPMCRKLLIEPISMGSMGAELVGMMPAVEGLSPMDREAFLASLSQRGPGGFSGVMMHRMREDAVRNEESYGGVMG